MKRISFILALLVIGCSQAYAAGLIGIIRTSKALEKLEQRVAEAQQGTVTPSPAVNHAPEITSFSPSGENVSPQNITISWGVVDPDGDAVTCNLWFGTNTLTLLASNLAATSYFVGNLLWNTAYQVKLECRDSKGSSTSREWSFRTAPMSTNQPPVIESLSVSSSVIFRNKIATITCSASDPDGDSLEYQWRCDAGTLLIQGTPGPIVQWQAPSSEGTYTITCKVKDPYGATDTKSIKVLVDRRLPLGGTIYGKGELGNGGFGQNPGEISMEGVYYDPDTGLLSGYAWGPTVGTLSFQLEDLQNPPIAGPLGTITYCGIRPDGKLIGWGRFINFPDTPEEHRCWLSVSSDSDGSPIKYNVVFNKTTGKFDSWSWGDGWGWINWGSYYGSQYGVYIKDWK